MARSHDLLPINNNQKISVDPPSLTFDAGQHPSLRTCHPLIRHGTGAHSITKSFRVPTRNDYPDNCLIRACLR